QGPAAPPPPPHFVLTGGPGTGKTTVARMLGEILHALGILLFPEVIDVSLEDFTGQYVGQTQKRVDDLLARAQGKVLFIDEAYTLANNQFGREAIDQLLRPLADKHRTMSVVVAGYPKNMNAFFAANKGLRRRFDYTIHLPDYSPVERTQIFLYMARERGFTWDEAFEQAVLAYFERRGVEGDGDFANAGGAERLLNQTLDRQASRILALDPAAEANDFRSQLLPEDLPAFED
ncbi:MAG TPA: AAA family ATPase, partial [Gemmatimonadaceae bacterium]